MKTLLAQVVKDLSNALKIITDITVSRSAVDTENLKPY